MIRGINKTLTKRYYLNKDNITSPNLSEQGLERNVETWGQETKQAG